MKNTGPCLTMGPPSDCLATIMDRFSGVQPVSAAAVFRRRSLHGRYMITTVRRNAHSPAIRSCGFQERLQAVCGSPGKAFPCVPLAPVTFTTALTMSADD